MDFGVLEFGVALLGVAVGIVFGAIPGMTATMAVAVFLPITYSFNTSAALYLLLGLYVGGISGGLIPAILINIPGTPSSICTTFDGYPMARRGEGERALKIGITASLIGGLISLLCLALLTPLLAQLAINFGYVEKFLLILFAMTVIAALSKGSMVKGVFAGFLGVLFSLVGQYSDNFKMRLAPESTKMVLGSGFQLLPVLIGLFAIAQMLMEAENGMRHKQKSLSMDGKAPAGFSFLRDFKGQLVNLIRSSALGTLMGILPGVGGSAASLLSYSQAKSWSKNPGKLGTGVPEGLIASEAANNGLTGGALIPLLSLGIPGDSTTAVLIGAFMLHGLQVGPLFITQNPTLWNSILFALLICNILMFLLMFFQIKFIAKVVNVPGARLYPIIVIMCIVGAYSIRSGNMFDVWCLVIFGLLAYFFHKIKLPVPPFLIGFILGSNLEYYFVKALSSKHTLLCFFQSPIGWVIWALILLSVGYSFYDSRKAKKSNGCG